MKDNFCHHKASQFIRDAIIYIIMYVSVSSNKPLHATMYCMLDDIMCVGEMIYNTGLLEKASLHCDQ